MSTTRGIRTAVGVALASSVLLIAGCSSSGSVGGKSDSAKGSDKTFSAPAAGGDKTTAAGDKSSDKSSDKPSDSSSSDSSDSDSSSSLGGDDAGCNAAIDTATNAMSKMDTSDPSSAKKSLQDIAKQMHDAAGKSKKPGAAAAINKLADDYAGLADAMSSGKMPDTSAIMDDAQAMTKACIG